MERQAILECLMTVAAQNLEVQLPPQIQESDRLFEDLGIDSIMVLQLIVYIEEEFHVAIPEDGVNPEVFQTVGNLISFIQTLQGSQMQV